MIKKLTNKFVILSMSALFLLLTVIVAAMNVINYNSVINESDTVLSIISQNKGNLPDLREENIHKIPPNIIPEQPYDSRYFSVTVNTSGNVIHTQTANNITVDTATAKQYADSVVQKNKERGFVNRFRYLCSKENGAFKITFLDCGRELEAFNRFLLISVFISLIGFTAVFFIVSFFAKKIIKPIAESYEKQKRFITDAGHEIKTPLTIINANVDVLEMELGENECLSDIQTQTKRLTSLTNDLVYLARMEEANNSLQMIDFPVSEVVADTAAPFTTLAQAQNKELICNIQPMLSVYGNDKSISQIISILLDNALKYSPENSKILLNLYKQSKNLYISVSNTALTEMSGENLQRLFDRFYRTDPSRNSETGGHGIGLSIAKAIVSAHGGKIQAFLSKENIFQIIVALPI